MAVALEPCGPASRKVAIKLHVIWGHDLAHHLKRVPVEIDGDSEVLPGRVDEVPRQCEVRRIFDKAPHSPVAGTSSVPPFNGKF